jgi:hypothetical protein
MFHSSNPSLFGRSMDVASQSHELRSTVSKLRSVCLSLLGREPPAFASARLGLSDLAGHMSVYFDTEKSAAHFKAIVEECPSLEAQARSVERNREDLKQSVAWLGGLVSHANATRLARHIGSLLDRFEKHEHTENELLQDFFRKSGEPASKRVHR